MNRNIMNDKEFVGLIKKIIKEETSSETIQYTPPKTGELAKLLKPYTLELFDKEGKKVRTINLTDFTYGDSGLAFKYEVKRKNGTIKKGVIDYFCSWGDNVFLDKQHSLKYFYNKDFAKQLPEYCRGASSQRI